MRENKPYGSATIERSVFTSFQYYALYNGNFIQVKKFKEIPDADLSKTLIITISPVCAYCTDQLPKWKSLVDDVGAKHGWHTIWISDGSPAQTKAYCDKYSIPSSDVLSYPVYMTYLELNLRSVPTTIVVKNGVISTQWFGTLKPNDWIGLRQALES